MEKWGFNLKARNNFQNHTVDMFWAGGLCYCQHCVLLSFTTTYTCSSMQKILILAPFSLKSAGLYLHETETAIRVLFFFLCLGSAPNRQLPIQVRWKELTGGTHFTSLSPWNKKRWENTSDIFLRIGKFMLYFPLRYIMYREDSVKLLGC